MKYPRLTQFQRSVEAAPLPAALAGALLVALFIQAALPIEAELPPIEAGAPVRAARRAETTLTPIGPLTQRDIFAPAAAGASGAGGAGGGQALTLLGTARSRSGAAAVLAGSAGPVTVRLGQTIDGMRLVRVGRDLVVLAGPAGSLVLRVGQNASLPAVAPPVPEEGLQ